MKRFAAAVERNGANTITDVQVDQHIRIGTDIYQVKAKSYGLTGLYDSFIVPDALLKTGYIAYDENKNTQARAIFQQVISKYPQSQAANLAKQRLARMDAEKR